MRDLRVIKAHLAVTLFATASGCFVGCGSHDDPASTEAKGSSGSSGKGTLSTAGAIQFSATAKTSSMTSGGSAPTSSAANPAASTSAGNTSTMDTNLGANAGGNLNATRVESSGSATIGVGGNATPSVGGSTAAANAGGITGGKANANTGGKANANTGGKTSTGGKPSAGGNASSGGRVSTGGRPNVGGTAGALVVPAAGAGGLAAPCATYVTKPTVLGRLFEGATGISGIVASRKQPGVFWIHSDRQKNLFAIDSSGKLLGTWEITSTARFFYLYNWEDISIQSVSGGPDRIWVGDIGNNCIRPETGCDSDPRTEIRVLSIDEPSVQGEPPITGTAPVIDDLKFTYPDGLHDAEGMAVDPLTGDLYVISKEQESPSKIFRAPAPLAGGAMSYVGNFDAKNINAADFSPSGRELVIRDYIYIYYWALPAGKTWLEALSAEPTTPTKRTMLTYTESYYSEAIAFAPDESGLYVVSEEEEGAPPSPVEYYPKNCSK